MNIEIDHGGVRLPPGERDGMIQPVRVYDASGTLVRIISASRLHRPWAPMPPPRSHKTKPRKQRVTKRGPRTKGPAAWIKS